MPDGAEVSEVLIAVGIRLIYPPSSAGGAPPFPADADPVYVVCTQASHRAVPRTPYLQVPIETLLNPF